MCVATTCNSCDTLNEKVLLRANQIINVTTIYIIFLTYTVYPKNSRNVVHENSTSSGISMKFRVLK